MTVLRWVAPLFPNESITSFCSRNAALNNAGSARVFASDMGFSFSGLANGHERDIHRLAELTGMVVEDLRPAVVTRDVVIKGRQTRFRGEAFSRQFVDSIRLRACPACLDEDEALMIGRPGLRAYGRLAWLLRFVRTCPKHNVPIETSRHADWHMEADFYSRLRFEREQGGFQMPAVPKLASDLERYVVERIEGSTGGYPWLDSLPLQAASRTAELCGAVVHHGTSVDLDELSPEALADCGNRGFEIMAKGENAFRDALRTLTAKYYREVLTKHDPGVYFGPLAVELRENQEMPGYLRMLSIMQDVAIEELPIGPGQTFLWPVTHRRLHSVETASREYGISRVALGRALSTRGITSWRHDKGRSQTAVFEVSRIEETIEEIRTLVDRKTACLLLGVTQAMMDAVERIGLIAPFYEYERKGGLMKAYRPKDIEKVLSKLRLLAKPMEDNAGSRSLSQSHAAGFSTENIISALFDGRISNVYLDPTKTGFASILVDMAEVAYLRNAGEPPAMTRREVATLLRVHNYVVNRLVDAGYLTLTVPRKHHVFGILAAEVHQFHDTYVSVAHLELIQPQKAANFKAERLREGIGVSIPTGVVGTEFYRRSDLSHIISGLQI
ncbi:TniQ family protein [Rhizobium leguminosarum]|uniref:TniQ family protein n=1 Tax=Rhizobium leguminosarum TaxID=384 RepID=UPI003F9B3944